MTYREGGRPARALGDGAGERAAVCLIGAAMFALALIGMYVSFQTVYEYVLPWFHHTAWAVPVSIDVAILVFSAADLLLSYWRMAKPSMRLIPWGFTAATIWLNWQAGGPSRSASPTRRCRRCGCCSASTPATSSPPAWAWPEPAPPERLPDLPSVEPKFGQLPEPDRESCTRTSGSARQRAVALLASEPDLPGTELARRLGVTTGYGRRLRSELLNTTNGYR
jgi:hypothetical protein